MGAKRHRWEGGYWIKLPDGRRSYRIEKRRCRLCGTNHHLVAGRTEAEARAFLHEWSANGHHEPGEARREAAEKDLHLADATEKFLNVAEAELSAGTMRGYRSGMRRWCRYLGERGVYRLSGLKPVLWIDFPTWRRALRGRRGETCGDPGVYQDQVAMRAFIRWALASEFLDADPFPRTRCKAVKPDTESTDPRDVTIEDVRKLSTAMLSPEKNRLGRPRKDTDAVACNLLLWAIYYWGARAASWRREWRLNEAERSVFWPGPSMKNRKGHRLSTDDAEKFEVLVKLKAAGVPATHTWERAFRAAADKAGLGHLRGHDLRAGCAQRLEDEGRHPHAIMQAMQWTQFKVARRYLRRERSLKI